jgi:hypothetical protein
MMLSTLVVDGSRGGAIDPTTLCLRKHPTGLYLQEARCRESQNLADRQIIQSLGDAVGGQ